MRVAVTGASGFIGRHVVRALRDRGATVIAISRHPDTPYDRSVIPIALDVAIANDFTLDQIGNPDALVHLAWGGLPNYHASHHLERELPIHMRFLESCVNAGLEHLIVTGTCLEYGMQAGELSETAIRAPVTTYGRAKCALYEHLSTLRDVHGFGLSWLRLFYLYGSGQASTSLYSQLRKAIRSGDRKFDMSAGNQIRDFLAVETASAHIAQLTLAHADVGSINICSGLPMSVIDLVRDWLRSWNADIQLNTGVHPYPDYEPFAFWGDARRLRSVLAAT